MSNPYGDRGNKDLSIANPKGQGTAQPVKGGGKSHPAPGGPFLIGDTMTGGYGKGPDILHGCTIAVEKGEIAVIVGPNGAGKSPAMKAVFGMLNVRSGAVRLGGEDITTLSPQERVIKGMGFVPQTSNIFTSMTVEENLMLGAYTRNNKPAIANDLERVYTFFPRLLERRTQLSATLSGGEVQMLVIGRGLMASPKLLMLDEPSSALAPKVVMDIFSTINRIRKSGLSILMVEQNVRMALLLADYGYIIRDGVILLEGEARDLISDPNVKASFLGGTVVDTTRDIKA
ncbi:ABC transporter ATP-binding protein [uncultured Sulfitobacter sp.]|uniref:ABC transporter ATP-binding protein n=1 Tax=uncultured Sulfitobacter sp. TaxID=191468 RepID=UPI002596663F|nr:ABC transporter ATP-binding protein [uncultured Sulfitobacter sp.]